MTATVAPASVVDWEALSAPFPASEVKQRPGPGGRSLSYIDARAVAQRLDDVVSPTLWEFTCQVIPGSDVVKGRLVIAGIVREDHGYPNSDRDEEPIKAATSDALKRCAVLFGIGRHLYDDNSGAHGTSSPVRTVAAAARPVAATNPYGAPKPHDDPYPDDLSDLDAPASAGTCPIHGAEFRLVPAGTSKRTGKPYDAFWSCPEMGCKEKPH